MRSLRGRLTLGVLLVLVVMGVPAGTYVAHYVERDQRDAVDERLRRTAEFSRAAALAAIDEEVPADDRRLDAVLAATGTSVRLVLAGRALLQPGPRPPAWPPAGSGLRSYAAGGTTYRAYTVRLTDPGLDAARLEVTTSLAGVLRRRTELRRRLLTLGAIALVLAGAGTWLLAGAVLRPLRRLRAVASSVARDEDLSRRVPPDDGPAEVRSLAASFNAMLGRLGRSAAERERALAATRRFAADAGHELRTPLTSVQATLEVLGAHPELDPERRTELARSAMAEQRRLVALLDGLQALARGDAAPAAPGRVDFAEVVEDAVRDAGGTGIGVELPDVPVEIEGWEPGLRTVADNLVRNAVRHGGGGRVHVGLVREGAWAVLRVDDDGPGIPAAQRRLVFAPFARVPGTTVAGSGLGLALVAQQVEHHGGTVAALDSPLGGARLEARLPLAAGDPQPSSAIATSTTSA